MALTATLKYHIQTMKKTNFRRRQLRTSGITDEMCKQVAKEAMAGFPATDLVDIAHKIFTAGEHLVGLKGHRLPLKHTRRQTTADKLKHEVDNIFEALQLLKNPTAGKRRWARIFRLRHKAPTLRDLRKPKTDTERQIQIVALRHALRMKRRELSQARDRLFHESLTADTDVFREAYQEHMQKEAGDPLHYIEREDGTTIHTREEVEAALLQEVKTRYQALPHLKLTEPPGTDEELDQLIRDRIEPHIQDSLRKSEHPQAETIATILTRRKKVGEHTYDQLMSPITEDELLAEARDSDRHTAAGVDGVNKWWLHRLMQHSDELRDLILTKMREIQTSATMPRLEAIITFIQKKTGQGFKINNLRPLTLQHAITKILTAILAKRLSHTITQHNILNKPQQGFIPGGSCTSCASTLVNMWEHAEDLEKPIYIVAYDLTQAYDRVQWAMLAWAMHRMCIPNHFTRLILSLLTSTTTRIQTAHGITTETAHIERGVPQGDPIAPILFNITIDALFELLDGLTTGWTFRAHSATEAAHPEGTHTATDTTHTDGAHSTAAAHTEDTRASANMDDAADSASEPMEDSKHGQDATHTNDTASSGHTVAIRANAYADDIKTASESMDDLQRIHDLVQVFFEDVLDISLNFGKTAFLASILRFRRAKDGTQPPDLLPKPLEESIRYLFFFDWSAFFI